MTEFFSRRWSCAIAAFAFALPLGAVDTKFWQQSDFADFEKGNRKNLSLRSDGRLTLAPAVKELLDTSTPYLWAVAQDSKGNLYAAGGGPTGSTARLFRIDAAGKASTVAELDGLEIHALAIDRQDRVYAATAPNGKIYRVEGAGKPEIFFDPKATYVWAMAFAPNGDLFLATGDRGEVFRVSPDGKGSVFFRTEETHARSLAIDREGNVIIGTEPGGLVVRVSPKGEGFVLYQTNRREVTAVAVARDGSIYAAGVGAKPAAVPVPPPVTPAPPKPTTQPAATQAPAGARPPAVAAPMPATFNTAGTGVAGGSEIYRIYPDGSPRRVWNNAQDVVYALDFDREGRLVAGTGNKGNLYRLDSDLTYTLVENLAPTQVTAFAAGRKGELFAVTGNVGKVYQIGPETSSSGTYESEVYDAGAFSYWGRLIFNAVPRSGVTFEARSGNVNQAQKNWSPWAPIQLNGDGGSITVPAARFIQYRATVKSPAAAGPSPELVSVDLAYMPKNLAPVVEQVELTPANYRFATPAISVAPPANTLTLPPVGQKRRTTTSLDLSAGASQTVTFAKGYMGARWGSSDENGDTLEYKIEIRGLNESTWKLLKDNVRERHISFDSSAYPDGEYVLRITASDAPSNPPRQALTAELVSEPMLIDNAPPQILQLSGSAAGNKLDVAWRARDALSLIEKAEYSVNGGGWSIVEPVTRLSDSPELEYRLSLDRTGAGEHTVAVRVTDEYENQTVQKVVVR